MKDEEGGMSGGYVAEPFPQRFWGEGLADGLCRAAVEEVVGEASVEALVGVWREGDGAFADGSAAVVLRAAGDDGIDALAVVGGDVLHVGDILQAPFNLKGGDTSIHECFEVGGAVHVLEGQQVALFFNGFAVGIDEVEGQTAELCALPTVGTAPETVLAGIAAAAVADAEGAVHERLQRHLRDSCVDGAYVI